MTFEFNLARLTQIAENLKFSDLKDEVECDNHGGFKSVGMTYCPKCGEKL